MKKTSITVMCAVVIMFSIFLCDASTNIVKADTVDDTQTTESTETTAFTVTKYDKAITRYVTASKITTYTEPTTTSEKTGTLAFQKKVKLTGEVTTYNGKTLKTKWYQLSTGAYIKAANLSETKPELVSVSKYSKAKTWYAKTNNVKIRKYPSTEKKSKTVCKLSKDTKIKVIGKVTKYGGKKTSGTWYKAKVTKSGKSYTGYMKSTTITATKPSSSSSSKNNDSGSSGGFGSDATNGGGGNGASGADDGEWETH
jgi:hypothetical protein